MPPQKRLKSLLSLLQPFEVYFTKLLGLTAENQQIKQARTSQMLDVYCSYQPLYGTVGTKSGANPTKSGQLAGMQ